MDELEISGRRYISSRQAAKEQKYHSDYIGQLVRGGKVAGQKVGRAWYVDALSLAEYLGKEVPARGPVKVAQKQEPEPIKKIAPKQVARFEVEEERVVVEEKFERPILHADEEPEFALPFRKSGRAHTIAAINPSVKTIIEPRKIEQPIYKEIFVEPEPIETFQVDTSTDFAPEETFIPLKINRETAHDLYKEPEDSFYKVSQKGLHYVSGNSPLVPNLTRKEEQQYSQVQQRVNQVFDRPNSKNSSAQSGKVKVMRAISTVLIAGIVALGAGVLASYYLHSVTTVEGTGQVSGVLLSQ